MCSSLCVEWAVLWVRGSSGWGSVSAAVTLEEKENESLILSEFTINIAYLIS